VHLQTGGLNSFIRGKLQIEDQPKKATMANGRLELARGNYTLQDQKLAITRGDITFMNSPITNPYLRLRAAKTIQYTSHNQTFSPNQNLQVGIEVLGTAEDPKIALFSDPAGWSQLDILSLIILGQPASAASGANVQSLAAAAGILMPHGTAGVNGLIGQLQQTFGLSEFKLASDMDDKSGKSKQSTSFVMGKYLSPRLYLNYSLDIFDSLNILRLRYLLTKHWSVQSQASLLGSGVDILYSVEH
jgi:translocation and assembly module TamB